MGMMEQTCQEKTLAQALLDFLELLWKSLALDKSIFWP